MPTNRTIDQAGLRRLLTGEPVELDGVRLLLADIGFAAMRDAIDGAALILGVCSECGDPLSDIETHPVVKSCLGCGLDFPESLRDANANGGHSPLVEILATCRELCGPEPKASVFDRDMRRLKLIKKLAEQLENLGGSP